MRMLGQLARLQRRHLVTGILVPTKSWVVVRSSCSRSEIRSLSARTESTFYVLLNTLGLKMVKNMAYAPAKLQNRRLLIAARIITVRNRRLCSTYVRLASR